MNILLTGSSGFIGKNVYELLKDKHYVQCLDTSIGKNLADCDLNYDVDVVIHLAGSANVRDSLENPTSIGQTTYKILKDYLMHFQTQEYYMHHQVQLQNHGQIHMH